jgi:hypothetical protein
MGYHYKLYDMTPAEVGELFLTEDGFSQVFDDVFYAEKFPDSDIYDYGGDAVGKLEYELGYRARNDDPRYPLQHVADDKAVFMKNDHIINRFFAMLSHLDAFSFYQIGTVLKEYESWEEVMDKLWVTLIRRYDG